VTNFCPPELQFLKRVIPGSRLCIHLQCATETDTLSLINLGAEEVVGVDISEEMIAIAREKSTALAMNARWIVSDVLQAPAELNGTADLLYTGQGAINWIINIHSWAQVASRLIKPNGYLYIFEGHPVTYFFKMDAPDLVIDPEFEGYFAEKIYVSNDWPETYAGKHEDQRARGIHRRRIGNKRSGACSTPLASSLNKF
jgi:SAM-dependent methyltransferase